MAVLTDIRLWSLSVVHWWDFSNVFGSKEERIQRQCERLPVKGRGWSSLQSCLRKLVWNSWGHSWCRCEKRTKIVKREEEGVVQHSHTTWTCPGVVTVEPKTGKEIYGEIVLSYCRRKWIRSSRVCYPRRATLDLQVRVSCPNFSLETSVCELHVY